MNILIAPNAFKNSLTADAAAEAIAAGFARSRLVCRCRCFPVGDGGDGTAALLVRHLGGRTLPVPVSDPLGRPIEAKLGLIEDGRTAVIELADASGLRLLGPVELKPLRATTYGTGELIRRALDLNVKRIVLGVGGSATVDGGCGILQALGVRFLDAQRQELTAAPRELAALDSMDLSGLDARLEECELVILCDVDNPLLGEQGAAAVFGPQKGAGDTEVGELDATLARWAAVVARQTGRDIARLPRGGAAGGVAAGLHGILSARLANGIEYFLDAAGFDAALEKASLVVTGEGSIDEQTLQGKAPYGVALRARARQVPVVAVAGRVPLNMSEALQESFDVLLAIGNGPEGLAEAMSHTAQNLERTARQLANLLAPTPARR